MVPLMMASVSLAISSVCVSALTIAGMPSDRASIAVWLVGPPSVVQKPTTLF